MIPGAIVIPGIRLLDSGMVSEGEGSSVVCDSERSS